MRSLLEFGRRIKEIYDAWSTLQMKHGQKRMPTPSTPYYAVPNASNGSKNEKEYAFDVSAPLHQGATVR